MTGTEDQQLDERPDEPPRTEQDIAKELRLRPDGVDNHWGQLFRAAGLATILNIGLETGEDGGDEIAEAIRDGTQDTIGRAGEAIVQRQLQIPPTLTIRPGFPVRVMVTRDLILEPQGDAR